MNDWILGAVSALGRRALHGALLGVLTPLAAVSAQQQAGSIRGVVTDRDFDAPLAGVQVTLVETGQRAATSSQGNYVLNDVPPGRYTVVFAREGHVRQVRTDTVVQPGRLTDLDAALAGDYTELDELVVQDLSLRGGTEVGLLELRFESPSLLDSISSDLMSRAGASDAASALRLVTGASVAEGKFAVIRGLPDRYVSSQLNGVRLPSADENTRAVELDQFPSPVIESIQVSKTFTPDQQGDASGGAVDVRLKGIPDANVLQFSSQIGFNSQVAGEDDFLTYVGGGLDFLGRDEGDRRIQFENLGGNWDGAVGVARIEAPVDFKWSGAGGASHEFPNGLRIGGFGSVFYERDSSHVDDAIDDSLWVDSPGEPLTPQTSSSILGGDFTTSLLDVTQSREQVQWGALGTLGIGTEAHQLGAVYLYTRTAEDTATLAEDTRGKEYFFPGYDLDDPLAEGNEPDNRDAAPYLRTETLLYSERTAGTLQYNGRHKLPFEEFAFFRQPELDWTYSESYAHLQQPDKRQFGSLFLADSFDPGNEIIDPTTLPAVHLPLKPTASFTLGNLQRIFKAIAEDSEQVAVNLELPFEQWSDDPGFLKLGTFDDEVERRFRQQTFSNFAEGGISFPGEFDQFWSTAFPFEDHPITASASDVDYDGRQRVSAWYAMMDLPLSSEVNLVGGARFESTEIEVRNQFEEDANYFPPGAPAPLRPGPDGSDIADVDFGQKDQLPSIGIAYEPVDELTVRGSYSETVARQTFKELAPVIQQEFLGGPIFVGNPFLEMTSIQNYDLRLDYRPYDGGLLSASWFLKELRDPIEYVQELTSTLTYTTARNYPRGRLQGYELEVRQDLSRLWGPLEGFQAGANATLIDSRVTLPEEEFLAFAEPNILVPLRTREMSHAPEHLYNVYLTYDAFDAGTQIGLFYTVQGDTLVAGAGESKGNFVPSVFATEYDTLNLSLTQRIGDHLRLELQAKNLTDPTIREVYRSDVTGDDVLHTSTSKGVEYSLSFTISL